MSKEFVHLAIALSDSIMTKIQGKTTGTELLTLLSELNEKAAGSHKENNMRIEMIQSAIQEGEADLKNNEDPTDHEIKMALIDRIKLSMMLAIGDGGGDYTSQGFTHRNSNSHTNIGNTTTAYKPISIPQDFGSPTRAQMYFLDQPGMDQNTLHAQPFIERSDEPLSIKFAEEYYKYCCAPTRYPGSDIKSIGHNDGERYTISPGVLAEMEKRVGCVFSDLKISTFFMGSTHLRPTHGLLCQMFLMCSLATVPPGLSGRHLGDPSKHHDQFAYYTQFLLPNDDNIVPNRQGFIALLQILVTILKDKKEHGGRLLEQEIGIDALFPLMKAQNIGPFELYEDLLREQFRLVDNITTGDIIGFRLTPTGAMFLYMCCPNI